MHWKLNPAWYDREATTTKLKFIWMTLWKDDVVAMDTKIDENFLLHKYLWATSVIVNEETWILQDRKMSTS